MGAPQAQEQSYTYADYLTWTGPGRAELIDGTVYDMRPAPSRRHQAVCGELFKQIAVFLTDRPCRVYAAPFDVRLPDIDTGLDDETTTSVVQPDISVICDPARLDDRGCRGAPDFIAEVISPATAARDYIQKRILYERSGVREYWLIHPTDRILIIYRLESDGRFAQPVFHPGTGFQEIAAPAEMSVDLDALFTVD